mgnify:CR=1 FL=1
MERIKQLLGSARYKMATDENINVSFNLQGNMSPLKSNLNTIISLVSQEQVFSEERLNSKKYRFLGRLNIFTDNSVNILDSNLALRPNNKDWDPLFDGSNIGLNPPIAPNNWILQVLYPSVMVKYDKVQNSQAYLGVDIETVEPNNISGKKSKLSLKTYYNHNLEVGDYCYVYSNQSNSVYTKVHYVESLGENGELEEKKVTLDSNYIGNNPSDDDINFNKTKNIKKVISCDLSGNTQNSNYTLVVTGNLSPTFSANTHNLRLNDYIDIRVNDNNFILNGLHRVVKIIDRYRVVIDLKISNTPNTTINSLTIPFRRLDGTPSDYYIRKFKLLTVNDYEINKATSFGSSIYPKTLTNSLGVANDTWLFTFIKDINLNGFLNHRGGPITELYLATIKRAGENTFGWSNVTAHWDYQSSYAEQNNKIEDISNYNLGGVGTLEKQLPCISEYVGDFVEYNRSILKETRILEVIHRFTLNSSPTLENGYYIKPFQKIEIRKYSEIIEVASSNESYGGIPGNSEIKPNGDTIWRDLLEPGFIENGVNGVNYPYLNGSHYIYINKGVYVKRQKYVEPPLLFSKTKLVTPQIVC